MQNNRMKRSLLLLNFLNGLVFYAPVSLLVRTQMGITVSQVFWLQAVLSFSCLLFEVPAGFVSDRFGYKNTWAFSQGLLAIARLLLLTARSFPVFLLEAVVEGLSYSLLSGTGSAYLYTFCQGEEYALVSSKAGQMGTVGFLASTLLYSVMLPRTGVSGLVAATCLTTFLGFLITLSLPREQQAAHRKEQKESLRLPKTGWGFFVLLSAYSVAGLAMNFFYAVKVERVGLPYEAMTAVILAYSAIELLSPQIIARIREARYRSACAVCLLLAGLAFAGIWLLDRVPVLLLMVLLPLPLSIFATLTEELVNSQIDTWGLEAKRATVLSVLNMGNNVLEILFLCISAMIAGNEGNVTFLFAAVYMAVSLLALGLLKG
nr:MFS transporter [Oscillospiraceae bacterium]